LQNDRSSFAQYSVSLNFVDKSPFNMLSYIFHLQAKKRRDPSKSKGNLNGEGGWRIIGAIRLSCSHPVPNKSMGLQIPESLLYDGSKHPWKNTLNPIFLGVYFDVTE
jgi:hypothetical protein